MRKVPKLIVLIVFIVGALLISFVLLQITKSDNTQGHELYLDKLDIQTDNPQPAGKNITP